MQYGNAFGQGMQAAALKPADFFGNDDVLYLMEDMATGEIRLSILWEWLHKTRALTEDDRGDRREGGRPVHAADLFCRACCARNTTSCRAPATATCTTTRRRRRCPSRGEIADVYVLGARKLPWSSTCSASTSVCTAWRGEAADSAVCAGHVPRTAATASQPGFRRRWRPASPISIVLNRIDDPSAGSGPLLPPAILLEEIPITASARRTWWRRPGRRLPIVLGGTDPRLVVVVGPVLDPRHAGRPSTTRAAAAAQASATSASSSSRCGAISRSRARRSAGRG